MNIYPFVDLPGYCRHFVQGYIVGYHCLPLYVCVIAYFSLVAKVVQALAAASKTVECLKTVHSLHAYFLLVGDFDSESSIFIPIDFMKL